MKTWIFTALLVMASAATAHALVPQQQDKEAATTTATKSTFADFEGQDSAGRTVKLSDYVGRGKYVLVDFWASWCGPCRDAIPHVRKIRELYADRMNVYSISCDESEPAWRKAMEKEKMEWTQLRLTQDQLGAVGRHYLLSAIPRLILLDPQGRIVCSTNLPAEIDKYLEENLK